VPEACPRCKAPEVTGERCPRCGVYVAAYRASLETMRRGPVPRPAAPPSPNLASTGSAAATGSTAPPSSAGSAPPGATPDAVPPMTSAAPASTETRRLNFHGSAAALAGLAVTNVLLILLTLGVYYFWAKTRMRRYVLGETELEGDRFAYHGTGRELLVGFARGMGVVLVPVLLLSVLPAVYGAPAAVRQSLSTLLWLLGLLVMPVAMVGARRYRLSRTSWRGIRFSFRGRVRDFVQLFVVGNILSSMTLGLYYPVYMTHRQKFMVQNAWFGSRKFDFDGRGRELVWPFARMVLLFLPTLGLSWFWFSARRHRYFTDHTRFGAARFHSTIAGGALAWLQISNVLALVLTLGLAWPWTAARSLHFTNRNLTLLGDLDLATIRQDARAASATGEALSGLLDADFGVS
jgi:uncharacterized membrane protein YjgN (DUF898 family)